MKVTIIVCKAEYVMDYDDGIGLVSNTLYFPNKNVAKSQLKADEYEDDEIDIDTDEYEIGWVLTDDVIEYDTADGYDITVE